MSNALSAALSQVGQGSPFTTANSVMQLANAGQQLQTQQFNLQQARQGLGYQAMRMLMATNPDPSDDDVNAALGSAARMGGGAAIDPIVQNYSAWRGRGGTAKDFVRAYALGGMSPERQGELVGPRPQGFQTGAGTVYGTMGGLWGPNAGQFSPGGFIQEGLTPGQATTFQTVIGPDGRPIQVPIGTLYGTGVPGAGMPVAGGSAGGGGAPAASGPPPGFTGDATQPLSPKDAALATYAQRESGNQNVFSQVKVPGYTQQQGGSGYYQIIPSTWAEGQQLANIPPAQRTQLAIQASPQQQYAVASALYDKYGGKPWAQSAPGGAGGGGGGGGPFIGVTSTQPAGPGFQTFGPTGQPIGQGGGGVGLPGVARGPGGAPILTPPAPWMGPLWEQSAKQYSADVDKESGLASRIQPWQSTLSILKANPNLQTGPTSQQWNAWGSTLQQYGVQLPSMPGDSLSAYQELGKNLARGLLNSGAGSPTDMARLEAEASSPNINMVRGAIQQLAARQIGYERFQVARLQYFRTLHPGEDPDQYANQYRSQTSQWAAKLDPVAFGADNMTNEDIANYEKGLSPAQKENFRNSVREAAKLFPDFARAGQ